MSNMDKVMQSEAAKDGVMIANKIADKDTDEQDKTIAEDLVAIQKYKMAGEISNCVIQGVIAQCVAGASVRYLCSLGDRLVHEETAKVLKKEKDVKKGIAFPTCVSVNNCVCHFSPLASDTDVELEDGDVVKIDLGAHVDGFIASVAHTVVVGSSPSTQITGRKADILLAAHYASEAAFGLMKSGTENQAVTSVVQTVAENFKCQPIIGMLSHQLKQFEINGEKSIIQNPNDKQRKEHEKSTFELYEVYAIEVLISSGKGMAKEMDSHTTVLKKTNDTYALNKKASRALLKEVNLKCGTMPFCLRNLEDEQKACVGVPECVSHKLLEPYPVLYEEPNEIVAQFKFTVLLMPNGPQKISGLSFDPTAFQSENSITDEEVKKLITSSTRSKPKKKNPETTEVAKKPDWVMILDTKIEELREMKGVDDSPNLPLYFQLQSLHETRSAPVQGVDYAAIYGNIAALMRGEEPKKLDPGTMAKFSQLWQLHKQRILALPEVPFPEFKPKAGSALESKMESTEQNSENWSADELVAKEILLSDNVDSIDEFFLSHASLNP